jgi:hypothetical protein
MYYLSKKARLVAMALAASVLFQHCNVYHKTPVSPSEVRDGMASPLEIVAVNGKIHHFDHLEFDEKNIYGIKYIRLQVIKVPIPRNRIQSVRLKKVWIRFKNRNKEYYKYLEVNQDEFTGIKEKNHQLIYSHLETREIDEIHLLNAKATGIVDGMIIIGGFSLLAFIIFPLLQSTGLMPNGIFDFYP